MRELKRYWLLLLFAGVWLTVWALWRDPTPALALELEGPTPAPGDSVRFVVRFNVPTPTDGFGPLDSVRVTWQLGAQPFQLHRYVAPLTATVQDTVKFLNAPPGGSATGSLTVQAFRLGVPSAGVNRQFTANRAQSVTPDVTAVVFVDSAVAFP